MKTTSIILLAATLALLTLTASHAVAQDPPAGYAPPAVALTIAPTSPCNRPATDLPSPPNTCSEYTPVAPPDEPIPPACIVDARYQVTDMYGEPFVQLQIKVAHPELCNDCAGTIELERYGFGLRQWSLSDIYAEPSCAKDEAPLAWATLQILNTERLDALDIYTAPLPSSYVDLLSELGGW